MRYCYVYIVPRQHRVGVRSQWAYELAWKRNDLFAKNKPEKGVHYTFLSDRDNDDELAGLRQKICFSPGVLRLTILPYTVAAVVIVV